MTVLKEFIGQAQDKLIAAGVESADLDVRLLTQHVLGWTQTKLLLNLNHVLGDAEVKDLNAAITRRAAREPVSRIIGRRAFWKSDFRISPQTLDPRPDSETLVESALNFTRPEPATILDLGTGSGCLLLSLLIEWPKARGVGIDISEEAVATARENADALGLRARAAFIALDWAQYIPGKDIPGGAFDLVISNPPYIAESELKDLAPEVAQYDPLRALAAGPEGLDCYNAIAEQLNKWLKPAGWAVFEIGHTQAQAVKSILALHGMTVLHVISDLAGSDRVIVARRP